MNGNNINYQIINNNEVLSFQNVLNGMNKMMDEIQNNKKINLYNKLDIKKNNTIIKYEIKNVNRKVKIFGNIFVKNSLDKCKIICQKKEYNLMEYYDIKDYKKDKNILEIELKIINNLSDMSYMFDNCESLIYLSNDLNTNEVKDMSYMFKNCFSLPILLDISKWDINNVNNMSGMFSNCKNLINLPDISKWNTSNVKKIITYFMNVKI